MQIRKLKKGQLIIGQCRKLVPEGLGLSHLDFAEKDDFKPQTGFVWGVLPGERFVAEVRRVRSGHFHAVLIDQKQLAENDTWSFDQEEKPNGDETWALYNTAPERIESPCANFGKCGGCKLLNLTYEDTLKVKLGWLEEHLQFNKVTYPEVNINQAPEKFHYRNHVQVHINKYEQRGFYAPMTYRTVPFPDSGCLIFDQKLFDEKFPEPLKLERCVRSRIDQATKNINYHSLNTPEDKADLFTYTVAYPQASQTKVQFANPGFFQVNTQFLPLWLERIEQWFAKASQGLPVGQPVRLLELFSGLGFISRLLGFQHKLEMMGFDIIKPAELEKVKIENNQYGVSDNQAFIKNYHWADLTMVERIAEMSFQSLQEFDPQVIILNPPRSGFKPDQMQLFFERGKIKPGLPIIYSSCNGATLARDLGYLSQQRGYQIDAIEIFDFFPWTSHYEVVVLLTPA
jgi:23S rRNA (uracil1939-C5)-methyltransferase